MKKTLLYSHFTRLLPLLALLLLVGGCASHRPQQASRLAAASVPGTELNSGNRTKVRTDEHIKAYHLNRYVDSNDPNIMHEAHVVYRKESGGNWNLMPNEPVNFPFGPITDLADPGDNPLFTADVEQHQTSMMSALIEANDVLADENANLRTELAKLKPEDKEPPLPTSDPAPDTSGSSASTPTLPITDVPSPSGDAPATLNPSLKAEVPSISSTNAIFGQFPFTPRTIQLAPLVASSIPKVSPPPMPLPTATPPPVNATAPAPSVSPPPTSTLSPDIPSSSESKKKA